MKFPGLKTLALLPMLAFCADAAELRGSGLTLPYASPWQRATPQQEAEDDAWLLDASELELHLAVPRHIRVLKTDADAYYAKLSENWRQRYGDAAKIDWLEVVGRKWLICRRPSRDSGVSVFHLSTVVAGRAYSVLLFAPATAETLPQAALDLLAATRFGTESATVAAKPAWILARIVYPQAGAEVLEALVQDDVARLGKDGMVTGYGLDFGDAVMDWFIEGYQWKRVDARTQQVEWKQRGRLAAQLAVDGGTGAKGRMQLTLNDTEADLSVQPHVWDLCAPTPRVAEALAQLQRGARQPLQRLAQERAAGCPASIGLAEPAALAGERGKTVQAEITVALPPAPDASQLAALHQAGLSRLCLVEIALKAGPNRTGFGDRLIERARWYVVFEPGPAGYE
jgi:hypothetical protein